MLGDLAGMVLVLNSGGSMLGEERDDIKSAKNGGYGGWTRGCAS
jgi:hypothetical protein